MTTLQIKSHFTSKELNCKCGCGLTVKDVLLLMLEMLRILCGFPLIITSGARCESYNTENGGANSSRHILGEAVDIAFSNPYQRACIVFNAVVVGFNGIGISINEDGSGFIHLDIRNSLQKAIWTYK